MHILETTGKRTKCSVSFFPQSHAIRVVGTMFTFYKAVAMKEYIIETAKSGKAVQNKIVVYSVRLNAFDICNVNDRKNIIECMCSIRNLV